MSDFENMVFVTERISSGWPTLAFLLGEINNENYAEKFQKLKEKIGPLKFKRLVLNLCIDCGMQLCMCAEERIFQLKQLKNYESKLQNHQVVSWGEELLKLHKFKLDTPTPDVQKMRDYNSTWDTYRGLQRELTGFGEILKIIF